MKLVQYRPENDASIHALERRWGAPVRSTLGQGKRSVEDISASPQFPSEGWLPTEVNCGV